MSDPRSTNWFVRILIALYCILLTFMVVNKFFFVEPKGEISGGLITLILILLVLVLSEAFDQFSIGQLISISKTVKEKQKEVEKHEKEKAQLLSQLVSLTSNQNQTLQHINVSGDYNAADSKIDATTSESTHVMGFTPSVSSNPSQGDGK